MRRSRFGSALRHLVELACIVGLIVLSGVFIGLARGAVKLPQRLTAQECIELQVQSRAYDFRVGDNLGAGRIVSFACDAYTPAAWVDSWPLPMRLVRLASLEARP